MTSVQRIYFTKDVGFRIFIKRIGLSGFFIGPSIIGFLAEGTSITIAMAFPVLSLLVAGFLSRVIK